MNIEHLKCCGNCSHIYIQECYTEHCSNGNTVMTCDLLEHEPFKPNAICGKWEFDKLDIFERLKKIK